MAISTLPLKPISADFLPTLERTLAQRPAIEAFADRVVEAGLRNVFLVGCGGSLLASYPAQYLFDRHGTRFPVSLLTSNEFIYRHPAALGPGSLVVVMSHTGTTKETVRAAEFARAAGATVASITQLPESPLAKAGDVAFAYESDDTVTDAKHLLIGQLGLALLDRVGDYPDYAGAIRTLDALPAAMLAAKVGSEDRSAAIAARLHAEPITYVIGSGPSYGTAYGFAMCFLQEMQWMHAAAYNAGEFFHGAMEVITEDVAAIVLLGEDETRPMGERARVFMEKYSRKAAFIDVKEMTLPGIDPAWRAFASPFALGSVVWRLAQHYEAATGHSLDIRRYMFQVEY